MIINFEQERSRRAGQKAQIAQREEQFAKACQYIKADMERWRRKIPPEYCHRLAQNFRQILSDFELKNADLHWEKSGHSSRNSFSSLRKSDDSAGRKARAGLYTALAHGSDTG